MVVEASYGNRKILQSGMALKEKNDDLILNVDTELGLKFKIRIKLELDENGKGIDIETLEQDNEKEIVFKNHGIPASLGTGPSKPVEIGTINGHKFSFFYVTYRLFSGEFYKIEYTFFEG